MKNIFYLFSIIGLLLCSSFSVQAQLIERNRPIDPNIIRAEIEKRGLTEDEVQEKLLEKGITLDINNVKPDQLLTVQKQIEEAIKELEADKKAQTNANQRSKNNGSRKVKTYQDTFPDLSESDTTTNYKATSPAKTLASKTAKELAKEKIAAALRKKAEQDSIIAALLETPELKNTIDTNRQKIFGQHLFQNPKQNFILDKDYKVPENYVLGVGDNVSVSISGRSLYSGNFDITKEGYIELEKMPRLYLKGMSVAAAKRLLETNFSRFYQFDKGDFSVAVTATRSVSVNIVGEVKAPGTYTVSAANSAFNALFAAGGLSELGSVRNIQLVHPDGERVRLDLYDFIANPNNFKNFALRDGDYISVPTAERVVRIEGAIRRPYRYELARGEQLNRLLALAGGLGDNASLNALLIKRYVNDKETVQDVNYNSLKATGGDFTLLTGDVVTIRAIENMLDNVVTTAGAVSQVGSFSYTEGMRLSDLLAKTGLKKEARRDLAYIQRLNTDQTSKLIFVNLEEVLKNPTSDKNIALQARDRLLVFAQSFFVDKTNITVRGAVRNSQLNYPYDPEKSIRVRDAITLAGGARPDATSFAYIIRPSQKNPLQVDYIRIDLQTAMSNPQSGENIQLMPNDTIEVQTNMTYINGANVKISGAVNKSGEYRYSPTLTLKDLLTLAGGLKIEAAMNRVEISRIILKDNAPMTTTAAIVEIDKDLNIVSQDRGFELRPYDQVVVRSVPEFSFQKIVTITGEVNYPGPYALTGRNERLSSIIERAGGLSAEAFSEGATLYRQKDNTGYIILDLPDVLKRKNTPEDFVLSEGDLIDVPKVRDIVSITGATRAYELYPEKLFTEGGKINVAYHVGQNAYYYINKFASGVGKNGRKRYISVIQPNGKTERTRDYFFFKRYPKVEKGALITVGAVEKKPEVADKKERKSVDWGKILGDTFAQITTIVSIILLIQRL